MIRLGHDIPLKMSSNFEPTQAFASFLLSYLDGVKLRVKYRFTRTEITVTSAVPQCSALGPLSFLNLSK